MSKRKKQRKHAIRRFAERFDLRLTDHDLNIIANKIKNGDSKCVERQSHRVTHHRVEYQDKQFTVVYDKFRQTVVTVLPENEKENA